MNNFFKVTGYHITRKSARNYTHAVVYRNLITQEVGATFHASKELADKNGKALAKRSHLELVEICPIEKVGA
jgi:hypothetical protein